MAIGFEEQMLETRSVTRMQTIESLTEAAGGVAVVILAIIGLAGALPAELAAIAVIVLGAALLAEAGTVTGEFNRALALPSGAGFPMNGSTGIQIIAGGAILILGILALIGVHAMILPEVAVIVAGGLLILSAGTLQQVSALRMLGSDAPEVQQMYARISVSSVAGAQVLAGATAIVLGILALTADTAAHGLTLMLIALLVLGASMALSTSTLAGSKLRMPVR